MAVHLYGQACDLTALVELCLTHNLLLIEDCAEALGTRLGDRHVGTFGDIATFSFYGNKTITTGEGGMVVSVSERSAILAKHLRNQAMSSTRTYWHDMRGFNYRMTNICAAIGLAQLEQADLFIARKRQLAMLYQLRLAQLPVAFQAEAPGTTHSFWMCSIAVEKATHREALRTHLANLGIETRPVFYPAHIMPAFREQTLYPIAEAVSECGINLPSWPGMTDEMVDEVCEAVRTFFL
jgi:perosamine synthetase